MTLTVEADRYHHKYSIGAGGVVLCGEKVLLVRLGHGAYQNQRTFPASYVEHGETADVAVWCEVLEETGVNGEVAGDYRGAQPGLPHRQQRLPHRSPARG
jgi:ADP-ribose pyrophosphatase YjhB (NUDIX family)